MDFPLRLLKLFEDDDDSSKAKDSLLGTWNDDIESFLADPNSSGSGNKGSSEIFTVREVAKAANCIHRGLLSSISPSSFDSSSKDDQADDDDGDLVTRRAIASLEHSPNNTALDPTTREYVRAIKNFLRWYLQIFVPTSGLASPSPVGRIQSVAVLELMIGILVKLIEEEKMEEITHQSHARNINLFIFYATYSLFPGDQHVARLTSHLTQDLDYPNLAIRILTQPSSAQLALSVVRNIHNIASFSNDTRKVVLNASREFQPSSTTQVAPWLSVSMNMRLISFRTLFEAILDWCVLSDPQYPGAKDDKRVELVDEILAFFYAIKAGKGISQSSQFGQTLLRLLDQKVEHSSDHRIYQTKLQIVSILMDAESSFAEVLVERNAVSLLTDILQRQVTDIVENTRVDNSAVAATVPILACLNNFCKANKDFLSVVKAFIFPPEAEEAFQRKVEDQLSSSDGKKNMGPLDAPAGTLRWKLAKLLTWTESYIKRCTGELMWTLCSSDPKEFVLRVGLGNAMPILNQRGLAQIPVQS